MSAAHAAPTKPRSRALFIINVQNDYFGDGASPVLGVESIVPVINRLRSKSWTHVFVTSLHRPADHCSFSSNRPGTLLGDSMPGSSGSGPAVIVGPDACVQGSWGAALRNGLVAHESDVFVHYGFEPNTSSLSLFCDRSKNVCSVQYLARELELNELYFAGVALDGAVLQSVLDARIALPSVDLYVLEDACAASSPEAFSAALKKLEQERIPVVSSAGTEVCVIGDAPAHLPVDLPIPMPEPDETYEAALARVETEEQHLSAGHNDAGFGLGAEAVEPGNAGPVVSGRRDSWVRGSEGPSAAVPPRHHTSASKLLPGAAYAATGLPPRAPGLQASRRGRTASEHFDALHSSVVVAGEGSSSDEDHGDAAGAQGKIRAVPDTARPRVNTRGRQIAIAVPMSPNATIHAPVTPMNRNGGNLSRLPSGSGKARASTQRRVMAGGKASLTGLASILRSRAASVSNSLPSIPADRLIQIAMYGTSADMEHVLMRFGASTVDMRVEPYGLNALHIAIRRGAWKMVNVLATYGANMDQPTTNGSTPLLLACKYNDSRVVKTLLSKILRPTSFTANETEQRMTPLHWACLHCNFAVVRMLCNAAQQKRIPPSTLARATNRFGQSPLMLACAACPARIGSSNGEKGAAATTGPDFIPSTVADRHLAQSAQGLRGRAGTGASVLHDLEPTDASAGELGVASEHHSTYEEDDKSCGALVAAAAAASLEPLSSAAVEQLARVRLACAAKLRSSVTALSHWETPPSASQRRVTVNEASAIVGLLLAFERVEARRAAMLIFSSKRDESSRWSALHYGLRSGVLAFMDWGLLGDQLSELDFNKSCRDGTTPLQLASWNGQAAMLASLFGPWPGGVRNELSALIRFNEPIRPSAGPTQVSAIAVGAASRPPAVSFRSELDLAITKQHVQCARLLCRAGAVTHDLSGTKGAEELLCRLLLLGDGIAAARLLLGDAYQVQVTQPLLELVSRIKYPNACTFTFAQAHNPAGQYMYECTDCGQTICLVCRDTCHPFYPWECVSATAAPVGYSVPEGVAPAGSAGISMLNAAAAAPRKMHTLKPLGLVASSYCCCKKTTCRAIGDIDPREAAGFTWVPNPIDTRSVSLKFEPGTEMGRLVDKLAWNSHEVWSRDKLAAGWRWGAKRDDRKKLHPSLLTYGKLSDDDKQWDRDSAKQTLSVIRALGYVIKRNVASEARRSALSRAVKVSLFAHSKRHDAASSTDPFAGNFTPRIPIEPASVPGSTSLPTTPRAPLPTLPATAPPRASSTPLTAALASENSSPEKVDTDTTGAPPPPPTPPKLGSFASSSARSTSREDEHLDVLQESNVDDAGEYVPRPIDTSSIDLSRELASLVELLSKNTHDVWAEGKRKAGWRYAPPSSAGTEADKTSPMLVPYEFLDEKEKDMSRRNAVEQVKTMLFLGYKFNLEPGRTAVDPSELSNKISEEEVSAMGRKMTELARFKQGVANSMLFCAARHNKPLLIAQLLEGNAGVSAQLNVADDFGRSPLYWAVQRQQYAAVKKLLQSGASHEQSDGNGMTVLSVAAHAGDIKLCKMLLDHGAPLVSRDVLGLTPLHYAAYMGFKPVVMLLAKKVTLHLHGITVDFDVEPTAASLKASSGFSSALSFKSAAPGLRPGLNPQIREDTLQSARSVFADTTGTVRRPSDTRRRSSLLSSVRNLLVAKSATTAFATDGSGPRQDRLVNFDVSSAAALDPLSLAGLVQGAVESRGFDASRALALAHRRASLRPAPSVVVPLTGSGTAPTLSEAGTAALLGAISERKLDVSHPVDDAPTMAASLLHYQGRRDSARRASEVGLDIVPEATASEATGATAGTVTPARRVIASPGDGLSSAPRAAVPPPRSVLRRSSAVVQGPLEHSGKGWGHTLTDVPRPQLDGGQPGDILTPSPVILSAAGKFVPRVSPLTLAVQSHHQDVSSVLLKFGANATKRDGSGLSPYDRSLLQHNLATRVCDVLRESSQATAPVNFTPRSAFARDDDSLDDADSTRPQSQERRGSDRNMTMPRTLTRANTAQRLTANLLDRELSAQQQELKIGQTQGSLLGSSTAPSEPVSQAAMQTSTKTAAQYADEMEEQTGGGPKMSRWNVLRNRLPDVLRLVHEPSVPEAPSPAEQGRSGSTRRALAGRSTKRMFTFGLGQSANDIAGSSARRVSDSTAASSLDGSGVGAEDLSKSTNEAKRDQAERDRLAAARERAREKALRAAQREERETGSMVDVLNTAKDVQTRRIYFAVWRLLREFFSFLTFIICFSFFTPLAYDYNGPAKVAFSTALQQDLASSFSTTVVDGPSWQAFVDYNLLWIVPGMDITAPAVNMTGSRRQLRTQPRLEERTRRAKADGELPPQLFSHGGSAATDFAGAHRYLRRGHIVPETEHVPAPETNGDAVKNNEQVEYAAAGTIGGPHREIRTLQAAAVPDGPVANFSISPAFSFDPSEDPESIAPLLVSSNIVVGSIRIRRTSIGVHSCVSAPQLSNAPSTCRDPEVFAAPLSYIQNPSSSINLATVTTRNSDGDVIVDLDSADLIQRRSIVDLHRDGSAAFVSENTNSLSIDFTVYNPSLGIFAPVRLFTYFPSFGGGQTQIIVRTVTMFDHRFQPSVIFEIVVGVLFVVQMVQLLYSIFNAGSLKKWITSGWNLYELLTLLLYLSVLFFDYYNLTVAFSLNIDLMKSAQFFDVWSMAGSVRDEVDVISVLFYLLVVRGVRYARLLPFWGPILMAVISTLTDPAVLLYSGVILVLTFGFGIAHQVALSADNAYFSNLVVSWENLFAMTFAQQFQIFNQSPPRFITTLYFILWSILSVVFLNLMIGIVTDVYQNKAADKSKALWERHITQLMEVTISAERRSLGKGGLFHRVFGRCSRSGGLQGDRRYRHCGGGSDAVNADQQAPDVAGVVLRHGRFVPGGAPGAPQLPRERRSRWSVQARFLPANVKEAGKLDDNVRNRIMTAALGHGPGGALTVSAVGKRLFGGSTARTSREDGTADLNAAAEEAARKDPALVLFDVLRGLSAELEAAAVQRRADASRRDSKDGLNRRRHRRSVFSLGTRGSGDSSGSGSSDDSTNDSDSKNSDDSSSVKPDVRDRSRRVTAPRHKRRRSRRSSSGSSWGASSSDDRRAGVVQDAEGATVRVEASKGADFGARVLMPASDWDARDFRRHPERLAAFIKSSNADCVASVDRGIAALQQRLHQTETVSASTARRIDAVDASVGQLKDMVGTVVTAMQQQMALQRAAAADALQQLQHAVALHQHIAQQQQLLLEQQEQLQAAAGGGTTAGGVASPARPRSPSRHSVASAPAAAPVLLSPVPLRLPPYNESELERTTMSADDAAEIIVQTGPSSVVPTVASRSGTALPQTRPRPTIAEAAGRRSSVPLLGLAPHPGGSTLLFPDSVGTSWAVAPVASRSGPSANRVGSSPAATANSSSSGGGGGTGVATGAVGTPTRPTVLRGTTIP